MRRHKASTAAIAVALVALVSLVLGAGSASADTIHVLTNTFGGSEGPGGTSVLKLGGGIAVDNSSGPSSGDVYVGDATNHRIVKFDAAGNFLMMWGKSVNAGTGSPDICTNAGPPTNVCKAGIEGNGTAFLNAPRRIAVDSSSGPSAGDVYVAPDGNNGQLYIAKYDSTGHLITSWGGPPENPTPGTINGEASPSGAFGNNIEEISVDSSGNLFVWAGFKGAYKYAEDGTYLATLQLSSGQTPGSGFVAGGGNLFRVNGDSFNPVSIEKFGPTGSDIGRVSAEANPRELAFDAPNSDLFAVIRPVFGVGTVNLYHFNGSGEVVQPDASTCAPAPKPFAGCGATETFGVGDFIEANNGAGPGDIAVNTTSRDVYVYNVPQFSGGTPASSNIKVFSLINVPHLTAGYADLARTSVDFIGSVDPAGGGDVVSCHFDYGTDKSYGSIVPCAPAIPPNYSGPTAVSAVLPTLTLAPDTTYHFKLVAGNANGSNRTLDQTFHTPVAVAGTTTNPASDVGQLGAMLNGSYTGDGVDTSYHFQYGPDTGYGQASPDVDNGTGTGAQNVSFGLTGLHVYKIYHYRLVAHNIYGTTYGVDRTFLTLPPDLPIVESTGASGVTQNAAKLGSTFRPGFGETVYRFQYGPTDSYGSQTFPAGPTEPDNQPYSASVDISGLSPGTTYHFRIVATNFNGTTNGPDQTFTTPTTPRIASLEAAVVTQSSANLSALVNPSFSATTYHFEYGKSADYGSATAESGTIGADDVARVASAALAGLEPATTYHFRIVASNAVGASSSSDATFTTTTTAATKLPPPSCKAGFVKKRGKCVKKRHRKRRHHHRKNDHKGNEKHG